MGVSEQAFYRREKVYGGLGLGVPRLPDDMPQAQWPLDDRGRRLV